MSRFFLSVEIPEKIKEKIFSLYSNSQETIFEVKKEKFKKTEKDNLHLTLLYLGELSKQELKNVREQLQKMELVPFKLKVRSLGFFDKKTNIILWAGIEKNHQLNDLQEKIQNSISVILKPNNQYFNPHITIGRIVKNTYFNRNDYLENYKNWTAGSFYVSHFSLFKSHRVEGKLVYDVVERF